MIRVEHTSPKKMPEKQQARRRVSKKEWLESIKDKKINSDKLKQCVMDFLATTGNFDLVQSFSQQAHLPIRKSLLEARERIDIRQNVRILIVNGEIDQAIAEAKKIDPDIFKQHEELLFHLRLLKVIALIKQGKLIESVELAQKQLLPIARGRTEYVQQVEKVMTLLAFMDVKDCPNQYLCEDSHAQGIAQRVSEALTEEQNYSALVPIVKIQKYCEQRLRQYLEFPQLQLDSADMF